MTELEKTTIEVAKLIQNLSADDCFEVINRALQIKDDFILVPIWIVGAIAHNMNADKAVITVKDGQINFSAESTDGSGLKLEKGDEQ